MLMQHKLWTGTYGMKDVSAEIREEIVKAVSMFEVGQYS